VVAYEAKVDLWRDGQKIGSAIMSCGLDEFPCRGKTGWAKHKAAKSAAQTWAASKAYRMNFAYIAVLAGYEPTPAEEVIEQQPEHICPVHGVPFQKFTKGKQVWWAHKTDDGKWCNESKVKNEAVTTEDTNDTPAVTEDKPESKSMIDMDWLRESLEKMDWTTVGKYLREKYGVTGTRISQMVEKLSPEQAEEFVAEIQRRLEASGMA